MTYFQRQPQGTTDWPVMWHIHYWVGSSKSRCGPCSSKIGSIPHAPAAVVVIKIMLSALNPANYSVPMRFTVPPNQFPGCYVPEFFNEPSRHLTPVFLPSSLISGRRSRKLCWPRVRDLPEWRSPSPFHGNLFLDEATTLYATAKCGNPSRPPSEFGCCSTNPLFNSKKQKRACVPISCAGLAPGSRLPSLAPAAR